MGKPSVDADRDRDSDYDRPNGLLTAKQREYLRGESGIEPGSSEERVMRQRIRQRLRASVLDLGFLAGKIEPRDLEQSFDDDWNPKTDSPFSVIHLFNQVSPGLSVLFDGISRDAKYDTATEPGEELVPETLRMFEDFVGSGIEQMYVRRGLSVESVDVSIDVTLGDGLGDLADRDLRELSDDRLQQLLMADEISSKQFAAAVQGVEEGEETIIRMGPDTEAKGEMLATPVPDEEGEGESGAEGQQADEAGGRDAEDGGQR